MMMYVMMMLIKNPGNSNWILNLGEKGLKMFKNIGNSDIIKEYFEYLLQNIGSTYFSYFFLNFIIFIIVKNGFLSISM